MQMVLTLKYEDWLIGLKMRFSKLVQPLWKAIWRFLKKLELELPYYPVISLLDIYPKEHKAGYSRVICIPMFIAILFIIAKLWKQPS
jgi:hypothetical protein